MSDLVTRLRSFRARCWGEEGEVIDVALAEIERLRAALRHQEDRDGRIGTHETDCYSWGHGHYECALAEIERLRTEAQKRALEYLSLDGQATALMAEIERLRKP